MNATSEQTHHPLVVFNEQLKSREAEFKAALPAHIPVERFMRVVLTAVQNNPKLMSVERRSLFNACMRAAQDGLLPDGREGAIVEFNDPKRGPAAQWMPMIAGLRKKVRNSGEIATWDAHVVHERDFFDYELGDEPFIKHKPWLGPEPGPVVAAYSVAILKDGEKSREVMSIAEIHAIRERSNSWRSFKAGKVKTTPWQTDEGEMCRKTVARRHSKVLPMSTDLDDLMRRDDEAYDFKKAGEEGRVEVGRPKLVETLDAISKRLRDKVGDEMFDEETGEVMPFINDETGEIGGQSEAGEESQVTEEVGKEVPVVDPRTALIERLTATAAMEGQKRLKFALGKLTVEERALLTEQDVAALQEVERRPEGEGGA